MKNKKKRMGRFGYSASEFLSIMVVLIILTAIILKIAVNHSQDEKFHLLKYHVSTLLFNASTYELTNPAVDNIVYLHELFQHQVLDDLENPFLNREQCNRYETMVLLDDLTNNHLFTLQCGNYVIYKQRSSDRYYYIYKASSWQLDPMKESSREKVDIEIRYNYIEGDHLAFSQYYSDALFVRLFNERNHTEYDSVQAIPSTYQIDKKTFYRSRVLVKTISAF